MGVVYGDIGTSPLYAVNEIFFGHSPAPANPANVIGCISLMLWTITLVILVKYLAFVLRADNDGEGGTFALYGLLHKYKRRGLGYLLWVLMLAAGLLFGEGIITPAISVLSAVEGVAIATPSLASYVVPITLRCWPVCFSFNNTALRRSAKYSAPSFWFGSLPLARWARAK
jgi:KUP system potassium uptake protein